MSTTSYLDQFLEPIAQAFTPELARTIVGLRVDPESQAKVEVLRRKANEGTLTEAEANEYQDFIEAVDVVSIIQAKARRFLTGIEA